MLQRRKTRPVRVGNVTIGGDAPVSVQSMTSTDTENTEATLAQVKGLIEAGCEIIRISFPTEQSIGLIDEYRKRFEAPLVADIHFDHRLAIRAIEQGADKIRINPGTIGTRQQLLSVIHAARMHRVPIRIGLNSGSLPKEAVQEGPLLPITQAAIAYVRLFEQEDFADMVISLKTSDVMTTIRAYREIAGFCCYPLHVGVTEAGTLLSGTIKSAIGIGTLLAEGIGDTIRVSLTGDPVEEVRVARHILQATGTRKFMPDIISCPTCGRTKVNLVAIAEQVEKQFAAFPECITVAVMGCAVNGPGEARHADIGVACGKGEGLLFKHGDIVKKVPEASIAEELFLLAQSIAKRGVENGS